MNQTAGVTNNVRCSSGKGSKPCSLECFLGLPECQLSCKVPINRKFCKEGNGRFKTRNFSGRLKRPLKDRKTKEDGQADFINDP